MHRAHLQQWRDAVSLLLRGARATRWAHQGTDYSRPRVVVASQATMALAVAVGMVLLLITTTMTMTSLEPAPCVYPRNDDSLATTASISPPAQTRLLDTNLILLARYNEAYSEGFGPWAGSWSPVT